MSRRPDWQMHTPSGKKYYKFQLNGQIGYQFEDGARLTQREFDQLTNYQDPKTVPRTTPGVSSANDSRGIQLNRNYSGQTDTGQLPRDTDRSSFPEPVVGSPPARNYDVAPGSASIQPESQRHGSAYVSARQGAILYTSDRHSNRHSEQPSVSVSQFPRDDYPPAGTSLLSRLSPLAQDFVDIPMGAYTDLYSFVVDNPDILSHTEIDCLIAEARAQETIGNPVYPQKLIHHALLLRKCREIDSVDCRKFFKRLDDRGSDVRQQFVNSVKKVYATIQGQARAAVQQPQIPNPQNQGRSIPLMTQQNTQINRYDTNQPLSERKTSIYTQPEAQSRHETTSEDRANLELSTRTHRVQDKDGRWVYQDENGRFLQPARARNDYNRHRRDYDAADMDSGMAGLSIGAPNRETRIQNAISINVEDDSRTLEATDWPQRDPPLKRRPSVSSAGRMPTLHESKAGPGREFKGTDDDAETLDPRYQKRPDAKNFFSRGRVFSLLWHEPAGQSNTDMSKPIKVTRGRFGVDIFSHILRMVVVKELHGACLCLPVNTYGGRGVSKPGFSKADREAHSVIYMSDTKPTRLLEETDMNKKPIAVDKSSHDQKLDEMSRINFSRIHTVNWNVKVMNVGKVTRESMPSLVAYWKQELE